MKIVLYILMLLPQLAWGKESLCDILNLPDCHSINKLTRRSSAKSIPSSGSAAQFNPANVSHDRGFGVETFYQPGNDVTYSLVTGTGKMGAAVMSAGNENAFFGNRILELESDFLQRHLDGTQYQSTKYGLAIGAGLFKSKNFNLDVGLLAKYNEDIKQLNPGAGISLRWGPISFGVSQYQDDVFLDYGTKINPLTGGYYVIERDALNYQENFKVQTYYGGLKIKNLFLDTGVIKTQYEYFQEEVDIKIYSAAYIWNKWLFNIAHRQETSPTYKFRNDNLEFVEEESDFYGGVQYSAHKFVVVGLHYNYYLLNEISGSLVIFF